MEPVRPVAARLTNLSVDMLLRNGALTTGSGEAGRQGLDPAVSVELSPEAAKPAPEPEQRRGYERDAESQALVFRVTDAVSGDVIVQVPNEVIIKARTYTLEPTASVGERVEKSV